MTRPGQTGQMGQAPRAGQQQYLVFISQSQDEHQSTLDNLRRTSQPMNLGNWGYEPSTNTSYFVVWAGSESEARNMIPQEHRGDAKFVKLSSISPGTMGGQRGGESFRHGEGVRGQNGMDTGAEGTEGRTGTRTGTEGQSGTRTGDTDLYEGGLQGDRDGTVNGDPGAGFTDTTYAPERNEGTDVDVFDEEEDGAFNGGLTDPEEQPRAADEVEMSPEDASVEREGLLGGGEIGGPDGVTGDQPTFERQYLVIFDQPQSEMQESMDEMRASGRVSDFGHWGTDDQATYFIVTGDTEQDVLLLLPEDRRGDAQVLLLSPISQPGTGTQSPDMDQDRNQQDQQNRDLEDRDGGNQY